MTGNRSWGGLFGDGDFAFSDGQVPVWNAAAGRYQGATLKSTVIAGGAAGNHTVTGITTNDKLVAVLYYTGAGTDVTDVSNLLSEFTITAANTINNGGGTNTTGGKLAVWWWDRNP